MEENQSNQSNQTTHQTPLSESSVQVDKKRPKLVDGRCETCSGVTLYIESMKDIIGRRPVCLGIKEPHSTLPRPYTLPEEIESLAVEQSGIPAKIEPQFQVTFASFGYSIFTAKMIREGSLPLCLGGFIFARGGPHREGQASMQQTAFKGLETASTKMAKFWDGQWENYPERYAQFCKKMGNSMVKTVVNTTKFGGRIVMFWASKT
uniref:Uncharacterized protein n=1 Tax=Octactis speculum TaxID=3111310 RepID=A0A7S2ALF8_9STRA|mmetsp:Transcript_12034/g.15857  ORF Transcript_12034/g.15857 Transcript_12034/m.15857 type:complete len:206 (+) Transcript_12034:71-688(+)